MESSRKNTTQRCWRFERAETSDAEAAKKTPNPVKVTIHFCESLFLIRKLM
jgi:hypothetical protein